VNRGSVVRGITRGRFTAVYDAEIKSGGPEYEAHRLAIERFYASTMNPTAFVLTTSHAYIFEGNGLKHSLMGRVRHAKEPPEL
jgi:hypothetical protein